MTASLRSSLLLAVSGAMELASRLTGTPPMMVRSQVKILHGGERLMDLSKARTELGYSARDPRTSVRQTSEYLDTRARGVDDERGAASNPLPETADVESKVAAIINELRRPGRSNTATSHGTTPYNPR